MKDITITFPGKEWKTLSPATAGFDKHLWHAWLAKQNPKGSTKFGERHPEKHWGVVLTRSGYLLRTWGNPEYRHQSASVGKSFTKLALQLTIDEGLIGSDEELVRNYWTGESELSHTHKYLDVKHHRKLTFRHLWQHKGGFPVTNGYYWRTGKYIPDWARSSGNADYDNYAHIEPGKSKTYSSGGYWRLTQALTAILNNNLKDVLDQKLFGQLGIPPDRWDWLAGKYVRDNTHFYPEMPGYGDFVDAPYSINGNICVGGGGWVVMSPSDLARIGLLIATGGLWRGKRLIGNSLLLAGHAGGNDSNLVVKKSEMIVWAQVAAKDIEFPEQFLETKA